MRHYLAEEGVREIRSLTLYGLAIKKPIFTDKNDNYVPCIVSSFQSSNFSDTQRQENAFTAQDTMSYKVSLHQAE